MNTNDLIVSYPGFFVSEIREDSLWLKFSGNFFHNFQSFDRKDFLHDYFGLIAQSRDVKTVVIYSAFSDTGTDEYLRFFLFECPEEDRGHFGFSNTLNRYELHRFCNMIDQVVLDIVSLKQPCIHICTGDVMSIFLNISLSCGYRIVTTKTVFHNIYQEIGMLPKGGAPFLLSKIVGQSKAMELLLKPVLTAQEAHGNHIVNQMVPPEQLESTAMQVARQLNAIPDQTLFGIKRLVNYQSQNLSAYLEFETEQILKIGQRSNFSDQ